MAAPLEKVPGKAWIVTFAGTAINLCLGILYAWSVWGAKLTVPKLPDGKFNEALLGTALPGINSAWTYLSNAQVATPFSLCVVIFALLMIPGGRIQDKYGPKVGATLGGLFLAAGCIVAGLMKSYEGLIIGFGIMGGIGMGIGYAAPTPAALKWFGPHKRGLVAGLVVGGYGGAALYIAPLARWLIADYGLSGSFIIIGIFFAVVVIIAGQLLSWPPDGYVPPAAQAPAKTGAPGKAAMTTWDWPASDMVKTWQFYALVLMFIGTTQSGLLIIAFAAPLAAPVLGAAGLDPCFLWRSSSTRAVGSAPVCTPTKSAVLTLIRSTASFPLCASSRCPPYWREERFPAIPGCRHSLLAVWRRSGAHAVFYSGLLRAQEPGLQLRPGVHRLGSGLLHGKTWRNHQGHNRKPQLGLLYVRPRFDYRGRPGPSLRNGRPPNSYERRRRRQSRPEPEAASSDTGLRSRLK